MTSERRFHQDLPDLLAQVAQAPVPEYRDLIVQRTARMRQRPAWSFPERWLPMSAVTSRAAVAPRVPLRILGVVVLILITLLVGAALLVGSQRHLPDPFGLAGTGRVAYAASGDIYTVDPVTGVATAIVTGPEMDFGPVWSNDGTHVVFRRQLTVGLDVGNSASRLFVARADGSGLVPIMSAAEYQITRYAFSPDGSEVAYSFGPDATSQLWIAKTDGSGARHLDLGMSVVWPSYRPPNGADIVFGSSDGGIRMVDTTTDRVTTIVAPSPGVGRDIIRVSPDGSRVAYSAATNDTTRNTYRVQVSPIDGSGATKTLLMPQGATFQDAPAWSNDGTRIAVTRGYSTYNQEMTLAVLPSDGSTVGVESARGLTGCCDTVFEWAPDDKSILVSPEDLSGNYTQQLLLDPATASTHPAPWAGPQAVSMNTSVISDPAWQRIAP